jgi:single-stranded DNA-binding protein
MSGGSRVVLGRLQQRAWTAEDGSARSTVEVVAEELGPSLRWATATTTRGDEELQPVATSTRRCDEQQDAGSMLASCFVASS